MEHVCEGDLQILHVMSTKDRWNHLLRVQLSINVSPDSESPGLQDGQTEKIHIFLLFYDLEILQPTHLNVSLYPFH